MRLSAPHAERWPALHWDVFCRVIDNFGDIGVCWRLSAALAAHGQAVRLWADDASALAWMAPGGCEGVEVRAWLPDQPMPLDAQPGDVVIEAFGCNISHDWIAMNTVAFHAYSMPATPLNVFKNTLRKPVWINLEYLSAENFAQRSHGLASPVMAGGAQGMTKWFFYPGFEAGTGGLIRERDAIENSVAPGPPSTQAPRRISLFCYEPPALPDLLEQCADDARPTDLIVLPGRGGQAMHAAFQSKNNQSPAWNMRKMLSIKEQMYMPQAKYDALLRSCDLNFVRGEDSLVRAIWAGRAFVWQIYPQADGAHAAKLEAFLDWLQAPPDLREFHRMWNGLKPISLAQPLPDLQIKPWGDCAQAARTRLANCPALVSQLLDFVEEKRTAAL